MTTQPLRDHEAAVAAALAKGGAARSSILASWKRSAAVHGLDPSHRTRRDRLTGPELRALLDRLGPLVEAAAGFGWVSAWLSRTVSIMPQPSTAGRTTPPHTAIQRSVPTRPKPRNLRIQNPMVMQ